MKMQLKKLMLLVVVSLGLPLMLHAQLPEGTSDRYIRVAEIGQLADSINVWGNVNSSGRYIVPEDINLPELISFSFGYAANQNQNTGSNFSKTQIEVKVSRFDPNQKMVEVAFFRYMYQDREPAEMFTFDLQNNDIVTLQVRSKPTFGDYLNIVAPVIGVVATSLLLLDNLGGN